MMSQKKSPSMIDALVPIIFLIILLTLSVYLFGEDSSYGANQIALILSGCLASIIGIKNGYDWKTIEKGIIDGISLGMGAVLILLAVGALIGTWVMSGTVPAMIYYGLNIMSPSIFYFAACIICALSALSIGSSWTVAGTLGAALMGISVGLGLSPAVTAGAIISGSYFGDKMSPLSDTTNLAPAVSGSNLFSHIRYLSLTALPSIIICLLIFTLIGFNLNSGQVAENSLNISLIIKEKFFISPILFIVPLVVIFMIYKKIKAVPALFIGVILGSLFALVFQPELLLEISGNTYGDWRDLFIGSMISLYGNVKILTSDDMFTELLTSGGMSGMLDTIWLVISAMIFGGVMESSGFLKKISSVILSKVSSHASVVSSTAGTCIFFNLTASDQYLSIVVPGKMYSKIYKEKGLAPENLSRTLEDSGTVTSVLVPWNTCGAYHASVLNVATVTYLPFCFFSLISPVMTIIFAFLKIRIKKFTN